MWIAYGAVMIVLGAAIQHYVFENKSIFKKNDFRNQERHEIYHYPIGNETFSIACAICKNSPYTDGVCGECKSENKSHFELSEYKLHHFI